MKGWKIYFCVYLTLFLLGLLAVIFSPNLTAGDVLSLLLEIALISGVYSYAFQKDLASITFWKIIFVLGVVSVIWNCLTLFTDYTRQIAERVPLLQSGLSGEIKPHVLAVTIVLVVTNVYAVYKISFGKK